MCFFLCFFLSLPQENDLNDMLNSLYNLPVPRPFTPITLSVVGIDLVFPLYQRRDRNKKRGTGTLLCHVDVD